MNTVVPALFSSLSRSRTSRMPRGSRPLVGSSRISSRGARSRAAARPSRWRMPSEYLFTGRLSIPDRPTRSSASAILARRVRRARIAEALERVGLSGIDNRPVKRYSLGMRQRLGLAAALLRAPRLLILDEPTNGLDPRGIREVRDLLSEQVAHLADATGVKAVGRLVEDQQPGRPEQGRGQTEPLAHAERVPLHRAVVDPG